MFVFVPKRYDTPKWLAPVPANASFAFVNGVLVRNLFELKNALTTFNDEVIYHHVGNGFNHIADWVESCVKDKELATEFRHQSHRWGMIVALERHMMRTLNIPDYVAERWLDKTNTPFIFVTGEKIESLPELAKILGTVSDDTVNFHLQRFPNDISQWILEVVGDYELADLLNECNSKLEMENTVNDHLVMLNDAKTNE